MSLGCIGREHNKSPERSSVPGIYYVALEKKARELFTLSGSVYLQFYFFK